MLHVPGYHIHEKVYESTNSLIYRGIRSDDEHPVILKVLQTEYPTPRQIIQFNNEYEFTKDLLIPGIRRALQVTRVEHRHALILDYVDGETLNTVVLESVTDILTIAIEIACVLGDIHRQQIIHKDINPSNILISRQNEHDWCVTIIDFGISSKIPFKMPHLDNPDRLEGTLAYISPEQTGRMNRMVDYRTDLYSLGVTLYKLLTGRLPFEAEDTMGLMHAHLAKTPVPPCELPPHPNPLPEGEGDFLPSPSRRGGLSKGNLRGEVPQILSDIIMKLLAKNAEDRYQSAFGVQYDLEQCLKHLTGSPAAGGYEDLSGILFELAQQDVSDRFQIPQRLYGREQEIETLLEAFQRVSVGAAELMLVAGYSGVGKTALVHEVHKPMTEKRGYFVWGKFDQYQRNIPYTAFSQALNELCRYLLTESEEQLTYWRDLILETVGQNGQVLIDVIPTLELIIGPQPSVAQVGPVEAQNRFNLNFQNFLRALSRAEHPLVMFIDDWQWADAASLSLLRTLMTNPDHRYFLLIGAYRENEVDASHPFAMTLDDITKTQATITSLHVPNLSSSHVNGLISDALACEPAQAQGLADLVYEKTRGNAFFVHQFLNSLYEQEFLTFDWQSHGWEWNTERIAAQEITDNVVDLLVGKIGQLPDTTRQVLPLAACIGNRFALNTLAIIYQQPLEKTFVHLWPAVAEGLLLPLDDNYKLLGIQDSKATISRFTFRHDHIQQAAYSLIAEADRQAVHLQIGRALWTNATETTLDERLFDIVNHLNQGLPLISDPEEKLRLGELNLRAGRKAKISTAYPSALEYFTTGTTLLPEKSWEDHHALTFALYREWYECEYLTALFEEAEVLFRHILSHALSKWEQTEIYNIGIVQYTMMSRDEEALKIGREALKLFDIELPVHNTQTVAQRELEDVRVNLGEREIVDLIDLPVMTDREKQESIKLLMNLIPPSYVNLKNLALLTFITAKAINIAMKFGNTREMPFGYGMFGAISRTLFQEYQMGDEFGKLAIQLSEKFNDTAQKCRVLMIVADYLNHWRMPVDSGVLLAKQSFRYAMESGVFQVAGYTFTPILRALTIQGEELEALHQQVEHAQQFANKTKNTYVHDVCTLWRQFIRNLQGKTQDTCTFNDHGFVEQRFLERVGKVSSAGVNFYALKLQTLYLYEHYVDTRRILTEAEQSFASTMCNISVIDHNFYASLTFTALYPLADDDTQGTYRKHLSINQQQMKRWAEGCPENFLHKYCLVEAEIARIGDRPWEAVVLYRKAIETARNHKCIRDEALANELLAKFWLTQDDEKLAGVYMTDAFHAYHQWGAEGKVRDLEEKYPQLLAKTPEAGSRLDIGTREIQATMSRSVDDILDLATVMKASHAISGEIVLSKLLSTMIHIVIENAGAQSGYLLLEQNGNWMIEAEGGIDAREVKVLHSMSIEEHPDIPVQIVQYVAHTHEHVVLHDAGHDGPFTRDPRIVKRQCKSVLCLPLLHRGQLSGIVYLENNLTTGAFTDDRVEVLTVLASQAAIALENARLYTTLEQKVKERTVALEQEIGERKQAEEKIRQQHKFLEHTLEALTHPFYVINPDNYRVIMANSAAKLEKLSEHSTCYALTHRNDRPCQSAEHPCPLVEVQNTKKPASVEHIHYDKDGNARYVEVHAYPIFDQTGKVDQVIEYSLDITERKRAEEELRQYRSHLEELVEERTTKLQQANTQLRQEISEREHAEQAVRTSERQYRALAESVADGIVIYQDGKRVFINEALASILGHSSNGLLQNSLADLFQEGDTREPYRQVPYRTGDGRDVWIEIRRSMIDWEGKSSILLTVRDITDRKLRELEMEEMRVQLEKENIALRTTMKDRYRFGEIIGKSPAMQEIYELVGHAAATEANVIICGESGTGKELLARTIHQLSDRREQAFVAVNCGAIPEALFEREFFGHHKGAFTGADRNTQGFLDLAHQGTLFLDEVAELSPILQVKLLRVLETGEYAPLGSNTIKTVDVRIVAATNRDLQEQLEKRLMREDFFYRIQVVSLTVPPLRERKEDIPLLIDHFLEQYGGKNNQITLPARIAEALYMYDWPGNIRQLQNVLQRYLTVKRLDFLGPGSPMPVEVNELADSADISPSLTLQEAIDAFEKQFLIKALEQHHWQKNRTARDLGIERRTLYRKMKKFDLG